MSIIWLTKLILSHLLTDFLLQKELWISHRRKKHFLSIYLYIHTLTTAIFALLFIGWNYWPIGIIIFVTHTLIDGWKSYQSDKAVFFILDQVMHLSVIVICWMFLFYSGGELREFFKAANSSSEFWITVTAVFFLTIPSSILISELTKSWRSGLNNSKTLDSAGRWIGIIERMLIMVLVLEDQYEAIGLLVAAKTIIRFSENNRTEQKTEYLLIGTLISISIALLIGICVKGLLAG